MARSKRLLAALVTFIASLGTSLPAFSQGDAGGDAAAVPPARVVILPFSNVDGNPGADWIGAGIADSLAVELQNRSTFEVVPTEHVSEAVRAIGRSNPGQTPWNDAEIGRHLGARWVVTGGYQQLGRELRITAHLIDALTGSIARATRVDGMVDELFSLQDRLAAELMRDTGDGVQDPQFPRDASASGRAVSSTGAGGGPEEGPREARSASPARRAGFAGPDVIDGPAPPLPPEVINRDAQGRATIRAVRLTDELRLDGQLDERHYQTVLPITDFVQQSPDEGAPATEKTEAWIMFDERNLYAAGRIWDSAPPSEWVANEMRRDTAQLRQNDTFALVLDTFYDRRNGVAFYTNALGAIADFAMTNEGNPNSDWNPVWDVRTGRFDGGWTVEMEIPFRSLRYRPGPAQVWGVQLRRNVRRKNEWAYVTQIPISAGAGAAGIFRVSDAATLVGLEVPGGSRNLEIKPYSITGLSTDLSASPPKTNDGDGDAGFDIKYGITQNLTADFTYNTDFAQVEADEQQVNLTRFSLFFPEKREFFLEGRGIFDFARGGIGGGRGGALRGGGGGFFGGGNAPTLFYSRRIGLQRGSIVSIIGGGRVTGKIGAFDVGGLSIQTDDETISGAQMTNFTVVRVKRDILRRSSIGALFTNRSVSLTGDGSSQAYGIDATFSFYENVSLLSYVAKTRTPGSDREDTSYQGRVDYSGDRYGFQGEHLLVEDNFIPEVGFLRRDNFRRTYTTGRFSPRPQSIDAIRQFRLEGSFDYILTADTDQLETRQSQLGFSAEFNNSDRVGVSVAESYEFLSAEFSPGPGVTFPVGGYSFADVEATYSLGAQHRFSGTFTARAGEYFDGDIRSFGVSSGRFGITQQFSVEPTVSVNWVETPHGSFRTDLIVSRVNYTFTPRMFFSGLVQYNSASDTISTNLRLRWEYSPGSELFVVYTEDRDTDPLLPDRYSELRNRGLVVKVNRLFRF